MHNTRKFWKLKCRLIFTYFVSPGLLCSWIQKSIWVLALNSWNKVSYCVRWLVEERRFEEGGRSSITSSMRQHLCKYTAEETKRPKFEHHNQSQVIHSEKQLDLHILFKVICICPSAVGSPCLQSSTSSHFLGKLGAVESSISFCWTGLFIITNSWPFLDEIFM